jgi:predicted nucleic acid-binding protein
MGQITCRSVTAFSRYHDNPAATQAAVDDQVERFIAALLTEDLQHGQIFERRLRVTDPFRIA